VKSSFICSNTVTTIATVYTTTITTAATTYTATITTAVIVSTPPSPSSILCKTLIYPLYRPSVRVDLLVSVVSTSHPMLYSLICCKFHSSAVSTPMAF
jgi:hypothetical protein